MSEERIKECPINSKKYRPYRKKSEISGNLSKRLGYIFDALRRIGIFLRPFAIQQTHYPGERRNRHRFASTMFINTNAVIKVIGILIQALITYLGESELAFQYAEGMHHLGAPTGFGGIPALALLGQRFVTPVLSMGEIAPQRGVFRQHLLLAAIGQVAPDPPFLTVEQIFEHQGIMDVGCRHRRRMHLLGLVVHTNLSLQQAKVGLVAFLGLMHLHIPRLIAVLHRGRRRNDRRVHDPAP